MNNEKIERPVRLFMIFKLLKSNQNNTKKGLSEKLGVSEETIKKDLNDLKYYFDVSIVYDRTARVYNIIDDGNFNVSNDMCKEYISLILFTLASSQNFLKSDIERIKNLLINKVDNNIEKDKLRDLFNYSREEINQDIGEVYQYIKTILQAIFNHNIIKFSYRKGKANIKYYSVVPYSIANDLGKYYLICKELDNNRFKHFRLDRFTGVTVEKDKRVKKESFNLNEYMAKTYYMYYGEEIKVKVRFDIKAKKVVMEKNMVGSMIEEDKEYFTYEFICNGYKGIKLWLLGFGGEAEVLEPVELREEIKAEVINLYHKYLK